MRLQLKALIYIALVFLSTMVIYVSVRSLNIYGDHTMVVNDETVGPWHYPLRIEKMLNKDAFVPDQNGVYQVDYARIPSMGTGVETSYFPISIGLASLYDFQKYLVEPTPALRKRFLANARWLVDNQASNGQWLASHKKKFGSYRLDPPWASALSQGLAMSVLVRAHYLTDDERFLESALLGLQPLQVNVSDGGLRNDVNGHSYYEEYPIPGHSPFVLNGMLYCLFGLHELAAATGKALPARMFTSGVEALKTLLPEYDAGIWSRYSLVDESTLRNHYRLASPWYQKLHVQQLHALHKISGEPMFAQYASRFQEQHRGWFALVIYSAYVLYADGSLIIKAVLNWIYSWRDGNAESLEGPAVQVHGSATI